MRSRKGVPVARVVMAVEAVSPTLLRDRLQSPALSDYATTWSNNERNVQIPP